MCDNCNCNQVSDKGMEQLQPMSKMKLFDLLGEIQSMFKIDFIVTGSTAFAIQGLIPFDEVQDIDIIVKRQNVHETLRSALYMAEKISPPKVVKEGYPPLPDTYRFQLKGMEINIFEDLNHVDYVIEPDRGYKISTLKRIINAKRTMSRKKDILQLNAYAKQFII